MRHQFCADQSNCLFFLAFISKFGEAASVAAESATHVAEMPLDLRDAVLHKSRLIMATTFNYH